VPEVVHAYKTQRSVTRRNVRVAAVLHARRTREGGYVEPGERDVVYSRPRVVPEINAIYNVRYGREKQRPAALAGVDAITCCRASASNQLPRQAGVAGSGRRDACAAPARPAWECQSARRRRVRETHVAAHQAGIVRQVQLRPSPRRAFRSPPDSTHQPRRPTKSTATSADSEAARACAQKVGRACCAARQRRHCPWRWSVCSAYAVKARQAGRCGAGSGRGKARRTEEAGVWR